MAVFLKMESALVITLLFISSCYLVLSIPNPGGYYYEENVSESEQSSHQKQSSSTTIIEGTTNGGNSGNCGCSGGGMKVLPIINDYVKKITGQWNAWYMTVVDSQEKTSCGIPYCSINNYYKDCGSLTVMFKAHEANEVYMQILGYAKGHGTLQVDHIVSFTSKSEMRLKDKYSMAIYRGDDGSVNDIQLSQDEIRQQEFEYSLLYADENAKDVLVFVSKNKDKRGENFVLVLVSEQSYTSNKYLNYKKTVMEILDKYSISRTNLKEIELHSINGVGGGNKGNCGCNKNKSTKDVVTISKEDNEEQNICTEITALSKDQEYASKISNTWIVWRSTRYQPSVSKKCQTGCSIWNFGGSCKTLTYTLEMENGKKNKLIWRSYGYDTQSKSYYILTHRVTTMTKKLAVYKDEALQGLIIYDDGSEKEIKITKEEKELESNYYALIYANKEFTVAIYATAHKIDGRRHAWVAVTENAYKDGSYLSFKAEVDAALKANRINCEEVVEIEMYQKKTSAIPKCASSVTIIKISSSSSESKSSSKTETSKTVADNDNGRCKCSC